MDCYTNQRCPECRQGYGPGPVIRPDYITDDCSNFRVAMAYVPWQQWQQTYPLDRAIRQGTIFPDLDKPFLMGRCR